jgi:murein L,D-transpeptidase YafK
MLVSKSIVVRMAKCIPGLLLFFSACWVFPRAGWAQQAPATPKTEAESILMPRDVKILEEHKDAKGNTVRTIQYYQGNNRFTETQILRPMVLVRVPVNPDTLISDSLLVIVSKSKYTVDVFYRRRRIRSYKAVFGPKPLENKVREGDRCTPEGWFTIKNKKPSKYDRFMLLDYPNDSSIARFNALKEKGLIPASARIGGDVGIHGIWKNGDDMIEMGVGWTDGCVALKNKDIEDLYSLVTVGTRVLIKK